MIQTNSLSSLFEWSFQKVYKYSIRTLKILCSNSLIFQLKQFERTNKKSLNSLQTAIMPYLNCLNTLFQQSECFIQVAFVLYLTSLNASDLTLESLFFFNTFLRAYNPLLNFKNLHPESKWTILLLRKIDDIFLNISSRGKKFKNNLPTRWIRPLVSISECIQPPSIKIHNAKLKRVVVAPPGVISTSSRGGGMIPRA